MDKYKEKLNPRAIRELDHIYEYIANEKLAPENAKGQVDRIKKAVLNLDAFPQSHQERNEGRYAGKGYRQLLIDNYIAIFRIDEPHKTVYVVHQYSIRDRIYKTRYNMVTKKTALCRYRQRASLLYIILYLYFLTFTFFTLLHLPFFPLASQAQTRIR